MIGARIAQSLRSIVLTLGLALGGANALAVEMVTEVLPIGYRSAAELLQVLRPLVPPPGSISGFQDQLIVRTTPANLEELKKVLLELDRAPANLLISVRHTMDEEVRADLIAARARIASGNVRARVGERPSPGGASVSVGSGDVRLGAQVSRRISTEQSSEVQTVRVLEGREAFIRSGESVPVGEGYVTITGRGTVTESSGVRYEDFDSGFVVRPRLNGDRVTLDILRSRRRLNPDQSARIDDVSSSVSGVLGRWIALSGEAAENQLSGRGLTSSRTLSTRSESGVFVKVERLGR